MRVRTGNYPGVTVEQRVGRVQWEGHSIELSDLPGTYSLSPKSPDEMVAVQVLTGCSDEPRPDLIICICNAAALERNLYLVTQVLEVGLPVVLCLNMWDAARSSGVSIDVAALSKELGIPVIPTSASRREGMTELKQAIVKELTESGKASSRSVEGFSRTILQPPFQAEVTRLSKSLSDAGVPPDQRSGFLVSRSLLDPGGSVELMHVKTAGHSYLEALRQSRQALSGQNLEIPAAEARQRYQYIGDLLSRVQVRTADLRTRLTDQIDSVLTHRFFGFLICLAVLMLIFSTIYWFSAP